MSVKTPGDYKIPNESFERKPTAGIQEIAEKPFTVRHIDKFTTKAGETMVIVETVESFDCNYKEKPEDIAKVRGSVNRFFASPIEIVRFFGNDDVIKDVNENGSQIKACIEKVPFSPDEIKRTPTLKGKTHYIFKEKA